MDLTDAQWAIIEPLILLGGILWVLRTGASWKDLPEPYPPYRRAIVASNTGAEMGR